MATSVQVVLGLVYFVCLILFVSFDTKTELHSQPSGEQIRETAVQLGLPGSPWLYFVDNPDGKPEFKQGVILSWSVGIMLFGFLAYYALCRIERSKVAAQGGELRWYHSTRFEMSVAVAIWAVTTLLAAILACQAFDLARSHATREFPGTENVVAEVEDLNAGIQATRESESAEVERSEK